MLSFKKLLIFKANAEMGRGEGPYWAGVKEHWDASDKPIYVVQKYKVMLNLQTGEEKPAIADDEIKLIRQSEDPDWFLCSTGNKRSGWSLVEEDRVAEWHKQVLLKPLEENKGGKT